MSIASVSIVGNLVKAPQQIQFSSGKTKTTMTVAVNTPFREKRGGDSADFYRVEAWGKLAELAVSRLDKGNQITANGRLTMEKWTDNKGGERITPTIAADQIAFPQRSRSGSSTVSPQLDGGKNRRSADDGDVDEEEEEEHDADCDQEEEQTQKEYGGPNGHTKPAPMRSDDHGPG